MMAKDMVWEKIMEAYHAMKDPSITGCDWAVEELVTKIVYQGKDSHLNDGLNKTLAK